MKTHKFARKPFYVDAVRVSEANIAEVAAWAEGSVETSEDGQSYVKVKVHRPLTDRQTQAFIGDWVLFAGTGYKVYTPKAFDKSFEKVKTLTKAQADEAGIKVPHEPRKPRVGAVGEALVRAQQKAPVPAPPKEKRQVSVDEAADLMTNAIDAFKGEAGEPVEVLPGIEIGMPQGDPAKVIMAQQLPAAYPKGYSEIVVTPEPEDKNLSEAEKDANAQAAIAEVLGQE